MIALPTCPECGGDLRASAPEGLCPRCLIAAALDGLDESPAAPAASAGPSPLFGDYELLECIGGGGMGIVHKARHLRLGRIVAIKTVPFGRFTRDQQLQRFQAEAAAVARLRHPQIVAIHEIGEHHGQPWFAMDFIDGPSLAEVVREQPLSVTRAVRLVRTMAEAVHYAHTQGIVHRDLKPSNILLDPLDQPHVTDFGLAKDLRSSTELTLTGQTLGSPNYMPPEQCGMWLHSNPRSGEAHLQSDKSPTGPPSDVYGLGAILYHLLTGRPPFQGESVAEVVAQLRERDPVAPRLLIPSLPRDLETLCLKCLEKDPARRYPSALELAEELGRWQAGEPIQARAITRPERAWRWCRRKPALAGMLALSSALLLVVLAGSPFAIYRVNRARNDAQNILELQRVQLAEEHLNRNEVSQALGYLTEVLRDDPSHSLAAQRLMSALTHRHFPLPLTPELRHQGAILDAEFSPQGDRVATASADGTAQLWNARTGERIGEPMVHPVFDAKSASNRVWAVAFSPDGRWVATASANGAARLWDGQSGLPRSDWLRHGTDSPAVTDPDDLEFHPGIAPRNPITKLFPDRPGGAKTITEPRGATDVCFSPDSSRLVSTGDDGLARIWDTATGQPLLTLRHEGLVWSARFSRDGKLLATTSWDCNAYVWDAVTGRLLATLPHRARVWTADFSSDGQGLVTGERMGWARVWKDGGGKWSLVHELHTREEIFVARFTPDGRRIVTADAGRLVQIWDAGTGRELHRSQEYAPIKGGDLSPDGRWFAIATTGEHANVFDTTTGKPVTEPLRCNASVTAARFSPDGRQIITGASDGVALVWSLERWPRAERFEHLSPYYELRNAAVSDDGTMLCTSGGSEYAKLWNTQTGRLLHRLDLPRGQILAARFSPDGRRIAVASDNYTAVVWRTADGQPDGPPLIHPAEVKDLRFSRDGRWLLTACADHSARLWDAETWELLRSFRHQSDVRTVAFSWDSRRILTASDDFTAQVWDTSNGVRLTPPLPHGDEVLWAEFSPDETLVATASRDGTARIWDAHTGQPLTAPLKHRSGVYFARFDPTGRWLATASEDRTAQIWDLRTGLPRTGPLVHDDAVEGICFGPAGEWIATSARNGPARFWEVRTGQPLSERLPEADRGVWLCREGTRLVTVSALGNARLWETPDAPLPIPSWMLDLAEAIAGQRKTGQRIERVPPGELYHQRVLHRDRRGNDYYDRWASWFFGRPEQRPLTPGSPRTTPEYIELLVENGTYESLREAADLLPSDVPVLTKLAELEAAQTPPRWAEAEFHLRRALELAPNDPHVLDARTRLRSAQSP